MVLRVPWQRAVRTFPQVGGDITVRLKVSEVGKEGIVFPIFMNHTQNHETIRIYADPIFHSYIAFLTGIIFKTQNYTAPGVR